MNLGKSKRKMCSQCTCLLLKKKNQPFIRLLKNVDIFTKHVGLWDSFKRKKGLFCSVCTFFDLFDFAVLGLHYFYRW